YYSCNSYAGSGVYIF
nr:immunoglobulin light chain junction region [Macaca mulatta]